MYTVHPLTKGLCIKLQSIHNYKNIVIILIPVLEIGIFQSIFMLGRFLCARLELLPPPVISCYIFTQMNYVDKNKSISIR